MADEENDCVDCKQNILNAQVSNLGLPKCGDDCVEETDCEGESTSTDCITVNTALDCVDTVVGATLTDVLEALDDKVCENATSNTIKITELDTCYGFLSSKVTSDSLDITVVNPGACEKLNIEEKCWTWTNINPAGSGDGRFLNNFKNFGSIFQVAQYSNVKECVVKLRGSITNGTQPTTCWNGMTLFVIPSGFTPLKTRVFSVNISTTPSICTNGGIIACQIRVGSNGSVGIYGNVPKLTYLIPLDGISWEIN